MIKAIDNVLITGGTGSLGTALVQRLLNSETSPRSITIYSRDELKQHEMRLKFNSSKLRFVIGDVADYPTLSTAMFEQDVIFHAAALKQVGACQDNPEAAVRTNFQGAANIVRAIREYGLGTRKVIGVSSDKGCQPVNVYGATKLLQEFMLLHGNKLYPFCSFVCVCYGNVMASRGSVIEVWKKQLEAGGPVTVTDLTMTRFLISLDQAVDTLLAAEDQAQPGEVYVPIIPATTIGTMVAVICGISKVKVIGKRPGEKMHEILVPASEANRTVERNGYYVITPEVQEKPALDKEYCSADYLLGRTALNELLKSKGVIK